VLILDNTDVGSTATLTRSKFHSADKYIFTKLPGSARQ